MENFDDVINARPEAVEAALKGNPDVIRLRDYAEGLSGSDQTILREYLSLPNSPDVGPEIMNMKTKYGDDLTRLMEKVTLLQKELGLTYDEVQDKLLMQLSRGV